MMAATLSTQQKLPHDLIVEILSWLPVKSLMRFRCVSKTWNSLIFHPPFVKLHLQRSPKNTHILLTFHEPVDRESDEKLYSGFAAQCSIRSLFQNPSSTIDGSFHRFNRLDFLFGVCNGLVSLVNYYGDDKYEEYWVQFWNPATRVESGDSPCLHIDACDYRLGEYYLKWGFGYDDSCDTYKVVVILFDVKSQKREVRVHCMGDNCWRKILTFPAFPILAQVNGQLVGESLNWLALRRSSSDYQWETVTANELVIFSYDLKKETYRFLAMPDDLCEVPCLEPELGVLKGCLVCVFHHHKDTHFVVWLMREFGDEKSWIQLLNVSYEHLQVDGCCHCPVSPLCKSEDDDDVLLLANDEDNKFVFYNQRDNTIERTEDFSKDTHAFWSHDYVQSLVLPY